MILEECLKSLISSTYFNVTLESETNVRKSPGKWNNWRLGQYMQWFKICHLGRSILSRWIWLSRSERRRRWRDPVRPSFVKVGTAGGGRLSTEHLFSRVIAEQCEPLLSENLLIRSIFRRLVQYSWDFNPGIPVLSTCPNSVL